MSYQHLIIIAPILNFSLIDDSEFQYEGYHIIKGTEAIKHLSDEYLNYIGERGKNLIIDNYCFYLHRRSLEPVKGDDIAKAYASRFGKFIQWSWFIRDNSAFVHSCFVEQFYPATNFVQMEPIGHYVSESGYKAYDSCCNFGITDFTKNELQLYAEEKIYKLELITISDEELDKMHTATADKKYFLSVLNLVSHKEPRLNRALLFLHKIRNEDFIIAKITFYMGLLECLFTSSNKRISKTVQQRASLFVESTLDRQSSKANIKRAYDIRSRYIHGDIISYSQAEIAKTVTELDTLTRDILKKILILPPNNIFTKYEENIAEFEDCFTNSNSYSA